jgi:hypothetical protein
MIVRITNPAHRHYGRTGLSEPVEIPGDWPEPRYRIILADGTITSATETEIEQTTPELTD